MTTTIKMLPLLLIHFNRPDKAKKVVSKLKLISRRSITVYIDGPRNNDDISSVNEVSDIFTELESIHDLEIINQQKNLGCGLNCFQAIKYFFSKNLRGIVIEDDVDIDFESLNLIENDKFNTEENQFCSLGPYGEWTYPSFEISMVKVPCIWGWYYSGSMDDFKLVSCDSLFEKFILLKSKFSYLESIYFSLLINICEKKLIDTWDFQFFYYLWKRNVKIKTLYPSIAKNIGFDSSGTHLTELPKFLSYSPKRFSTDIYNDFVMNEVHRPSFFNILKLFVKNLFPGKKYGS